MKDTNYCDAMQSSGEVSAKKDDCHWRWINTRSTRTVYSTVEYNIFLIEL